MRRVFSILFLLMLLFFGGQWFLTFIKTNHEINYEYIDDKTKFQVQEHYQKNLGDRYFIEIGVKENKFVYTIPNIFQKKKNIIKEIKMTQSDNMMCIYPIFEKELDTYDIECSKNGVIYAYEAVKTDPFVQEFIKNLKKDSIRVDAWKEDSTESTEFPISTDTSSEKPTLKTVVFPKNILPKDNILVWNYRGIDLHNQEKSQNISILSWDKYENKHGILVDNYYLVPVYTSDRVFDFSSIQLIDIETTESTTLTFPDIVSQNTYINGVFNGKVYYLDKDNVVQYEVNTRKKTVRVVGNQKLNAQFYNGSWETVNIYDLVKEEKKFKVDIKENEILTKENIVEVLESKDSYYYYTTDGSFYRITKEFPKDSIFLFQVASPNNVLLSENTLYYISDNSLYYYQEGSGRRKILTNNEFLYNKENRIQVYKAEKKIEDEEE